MPLVADLANLAPEDVAAAAQTLQRIELFASGRLLSFRHPLLQAAVLSGLGDVAVTAGHLRAARVLRERGASAEQIAAHLTACDVVGEVWAVDVLEQAARGALARASPRLAARLLERALEEPCDAGRRLSLGVEMGGALATAGDTRGIDVLLLAAHGVDDPLRRAELAVRLAIPMWSGGRVRELPAVLQDASSRLPTDTHSSCLRSPRRAHRRPHGARAKACPKRSQRRWRSSLPRAMTALRRDSGWHCSRSRQPTPTARVARSLCSRDERSVTPTRTPARSARVCR